MLVGDKVLWCSCWNHSASWLCYVVVNQDRRKISWWLLYANALKGTQCKSTGQKEEWRSLWDFATPTISKVIQINRLKLAGHVFKYKTSPAHLIVTWDPPRGKKERKKERKSLWPNTQIRYIQRFVGLIEYDYIRKILNKNDHSHYQPLQADLNQSKSE